MDYEDDLSKLLRIVLKPFTFFIWFLFIIGPPPLYAMARFTLIVQVFLALRALTPGALAELEWTSFIPHI